MMRTSTIAIALSMVGGAAWAQSASSGLAGLESCFKAARLSDAICMNLSNAPAQQVDCFEKARAAQLECLQHVPSGSSAQSAPPEKPAGPEVSQESRAPVQSEMPRAMPPSHTAAAPAVGPAGSMDLPAAPLVPEKSTANAATDDATSTVSPKPPSSSLRPEKPPVVSRDQRNPASPSRAAEAPDIPAKPPAETWVVSETTSPVDYSPLVTAQIQPRWSEKDAPDSLIIRCRQSHVELLLRMAGPARVAPGRDIQVSYRLNDQPFVKQQWIASADGKIASYPEDAAALLRSLPDGARLTVDVFDGSGPGRDAMFQLTGFDAVRRKVETACKSVSGTYSSEKR